ncbi:hypothetical protein LCGC14_0591280 [marine sediment metagenome]|uniref:Uncharacterized protein n=1 Tax=marine sediment metagenome TaxID=412755 RepID=A0A0F9TZI4_9ZZZZ
MSNGEESAKVAAVATAEPTEDELKAELQKALDSGDFKAVATVSRKIDTIIRAREKSELDAKRAALDSMVDKVKAIYLKALKPLIDSGDLDAADGIWISHDFGEQAPTVRLMKAQPKASRAGGGGGGKKFDISTDDMLARHGADEYKDGMNFQQAWEHSTDKNWRYAIRQKLLKLEGVI